MRPRLILAVRLACSAALVYGVWRETGPLTAAFAGLLLLQTEASGWLYRLQTQRIETLENAVVSVAESMRDHIKAQRYWTTPH
jgi:hypothetical protein